MGIGGWAGRGSWGAGRRGGLRRWFWASGLSAWRPSLPAGCPPLLAGPFHERWLPNPCFTGRQLSPTSPPLPPRPSSSVLRMSSTHSSCSPGQSQCADEQRAGPADSKLTARGPHGQECERASWARGAFSLQPSEETVRDAEAQSSYVTR